MKKNCFMKLKSGAMIFAIHQNYQTNFVHGYSLASPHLKIKTYNLKTIDTNWTDFTENVDVLAGVIRKSHFTVIEGNTLLLETVKSRVKEMEEAIEKILFNMKFGSITEDLKPFHESVVDKLEKVKTIDSLELVGLLIMNTKIPKNYKKIYTAFIEAQKRINYTGNNNTIDLTILYLIKQMIIEGREKEVV